MGLFTTTTSTNRVVDQGNTYSFDIEPAQQSSDINFQTEGGTTTVGQSSKVSQWRVTAHFMKRYRYVGMSGTSIDTLVGSIASAYIIDSQKYALGIYVSDGTAGFKYLPIQNGTVPVCCASVTPVHVEGPIWNIEVDVNATVEAYYDSPPTYNTIKALFSTIANFPEGN